MALLMVHLLAGQRFAEAHPAYLNDPDYYFGLIAPDGIHVRDHDDKSHKNYIHLNNWTVPHPEDVIAYWKARSSPFDIGYGVHVMTDGQWVQRYRKRCPELFLPTGLLDTKLYYHETFLTDFELYNEGGQGERLFGLVERGRAPEDHPLLTFEELTEWKHMMLDAYHKGCTEEGRSEILDAAYCRAFIEDCQPMIDEAYAQAFQGGRP
ncbi:MAG: hypothetical protein E7317_11250 [Clostridiales bacterium]|nr:hypothetical protein [Clostridiales bacterium]